MQSVICRLLGERAPVSLKATTLPDKIHPHIVDIQLFHIGFKLDDKLVVGFGMNYEE